MLRKITILFISIIFSCLFNNVVFADNEADMSEWKFIQIISNDQYTISKFYSKTDTNKYGFCLEPEADFNKNLDYYKTNYNDDYIFDVVKAYELYGLPIENQIDDKFEKYNYFAACQILIWEHLTGKTFNFAKDYTTQKNEIIDYINKMNSVVLTINNDITDVYKCYLNQENTIEGNYCDYEISCDEGIEIIKNDSNGLTYKITDSDTEYKYMQLDPKYNPKDFAYKYYSKKSQDIYCFEGTYDIPKSISFSFQLVNDEPEYVDIYYSKKR